MFFFVVLCLVSVWFIFFRKKLYTVQNIDTKEFLWKITKASEKLMSKDAKLATMTFSFASRKWSAVLECNDGNLVVTLNRKIQIITKRQELVSLGVGFVQSKGQSLFYCYKSNVIDPSKKQAPDYRWIGPSKDYVLKNKDLMLPDDVLTIFIRLSLFPSHISMMNESRQGCCTHYQNGAEDDKSNKGKGENMLCLDCKVLKNLSQNLKNLYLKDKDPDIKIIVRNENLRAHRVILKARSPVLTCMLTQGMTEIKEDDCDSKVFAILLQFLYSGTVDNMDTNSVISVYKIADKYEVPDLMETCAKYMVSTLTVHSVSSVISVALKHKDYKLLVYSTNFFLRNAEKIFPTAEWEAFLAENPNKANELVIKSYSYK